jgi:alkanesulfonate monooxygenase SsuD/methylene tetrahydromethanopterin reductase-like flavin-dependent oxidoreductase (luciferase family)
MAITTAHLNIRCAVYLPLFAPFGHPRIIADLARDAEQAGWDGLFVWDDVAGWDKDMADPWIALSAAAMVTKRVRLGALITPLPRRRPWKFARETASLDQLSDGRLVVGVGVGAGQEQFGDLGDEPDQRTRGEMLDEALEVVTGLWQGETFEHAGRYYRLKPTTFRPRPIQQPRIPIWVAGRWPHKRPIQRMVHWDGMFPLFAGIDDPAEQPALLRQMVDDVQSQRATLLGEDVQRPFDVIVSGETPADQPDQAEEVIAGNAAAGATWWLESLDPERSSGAVWSYEQLRERVLAGPLGKN